jgi:hypothetical protein
MLEAAGFDKKKIDPDFQDSIIQQSPVLSKIPISHDLFSDSILAGKEDISIGMAYVLRLLG